jgi:hypothetical protein
MFDFISRLWRGRSRGVGSQTAENAFASAFQVSDAFHRQFLTECRARLNALSEQEQLLLSRRVRNALNGLRTAAETLVQRCAEKPDTISDIRELPSTLRRLDEMLSAHREISSPTDPSDIKRNQELTERLGLVTKHFQQTAGEMLAGTRITLSALTEVIMRNTGAAQEAFPKSNQF